MCIDCAVHSGGLRPYREHCSDCRPGTCDTSAHHPSGNRPDYAVHHAAGAGAGGSARNSVRQGVGLFAKHRSGQGRYREGRRGTGAHRNAGAHRGTRQTTSGTQSGRGGLRAHSGVLAKSAGSGGAANARSGARAFRDRARQPRSKRNHVALRNRHCAFCRRDHTALRRSWGTDSSGHGPCDIDGFQQGSLASRRAGAGGQSRGSGPAGDGRHRESARHALRWQSSSLHLCAGHREQNHACGGEPG